MDEQLAPRWLRIAGAWSWRLLAFGIVLYVVADAVIAVEVVALAVFVALFIAALLEPIARRLWRVGLPRAAGAAIALVIFLAVIVGVVILVSRSIAGEFDELKNQLSSAVDKLRQYLIDAGVSAKQLDKLSESVSTYFQTNKAELAGGIITGVSAVVELLIGLLLALFTAFFSLKDGPLIWKWALGWVPSEGRRQIDKAGLAAWQTFAAYARGTVIIAAIDALGVGAALLILRIPLAVPLILITFLAAFIPLAGALAAGTAATGVALVTHGPASAILVVIAFVLVLQVEGHVLQPLIMSKAVAVHPLAVVLSVTAGSVLGGIPGAVVAVPLVATLNRAVKVLRIEQGGTDDPQPADVADDPADKPAPDGEDAQP